MVYNYINGEVTNEKEFINDEQMMLQGTMYERDCIPSIITDDLDRVWYLQQGMTLLLAKDSNDIINYIAIEQEIRKNEMAIKEIHSAIIIPSEEKTLLMYYDTSKEKEIESIKLNVKSILNELEFMTEKEIEYICSKIEEFFTKPTVEIEPVKDTQQRSSAAKRVEYNGKQYESMNALFKDLGIKNQTYYGCLKRGLTHDEAIERCVRIKRKDRKERSTTKKYTYLGEEMTLHELSKLSGINQDVLWHRLQKGWNVEEAVETPVRPRTQGVK